jgi:putative FmdB family regulatory protein
MTGNAHGNDGVVLAEDWSGMPTYEYQCKTCGHHFERVQRFSDAPITECPQCGGEVRRVIHPAGVIFKGSGWYKTDSRKSSGDSSSKDSTESAKADGDGAKTGDGAKSDSAKSESKPAEKATSTSEG